MNLFGRALSRDDLVRRIGSLDQIGGITPVTLSAGRANGVRALRVDTGKITADILCDRGLDVLHGAIDGTPFTWRSANDVAAPAFFDAHADGFLASFFGGWLTTCGLRNFGPAGSDTWGTFGLHGRINNLPADDVRVKTRWEGDRCVLEIRGTVRDTRALSPTLTLERRWTTELGSSRLQLEDRVVNEGSVRTPHMMLYHCNAGWPLLDTDTRVHVSHTSVSPRDEAARAGLGVWDRGADPQRGFAEQVFIHAPRTCADGMARAAILNPAACGGRGLGFEVAYDRATLPALFTWRKLDERDYVMAIEPANTPAIQGRVYAGEHGLLPFLEPGEERRYRLVFTALAGEDLTASAAAIASANATSEDQR